MDQVFLLEEFGFALDIDSSIQTIEKALVSVEAGLLFFPLQELMNRKQ
jgi:hypothetical protein